MNLLDTTLKFFILIVTYIFGLLYSYGGENHLKKTYLFGKEIPTMFKDLKIFTKATPRIIGDMTIEITAENTDRVEFYLDGIKTYIDDESPYTWDIEAIRGRHTLKVKAINEQNASMDIRDFYKII